MVESSAPVLACLLVNGLYQPEVAAALGFLYAVSRIVYSLGYQGKRGADGRIAGAIGGFLAQVGLYGGCIYHGLVTTVFSK